MQANQWVIHKKFCWCKYCRHIVFNNDWTIKKKHLNRKRTWAKIHYWRAYRRMNKYNIGETKQPTRFMGWYYD